MSDLRKAAAQVLEALDKSLYMNDYSGLEVSKHDQPDVKDAIESLRAALAKPEQKPVGWAYVNSDGECEQIEYDDTPPDDPSITLLYARPQDWGKR